MHADRLCARGRTGGDECPLLAQRSVCRPEGDEGKKNKIKAPWNVVTDSWLASPPILLPLTARERGSGALVLLCIVDISSQGRQERYVQVVLGSTAPAVALWLASQIHGCGHSILSRSGSLVAP